MKKIVFLVSFLALAISLQAQLFGKKKTRNNVPPITGTLTFHPDSVTIKGVDGFVDYCFLDAANKCLFVTGNKQIYDSVSAFLPMRKIDDRSVILQGTVIQPFTTYAKNDLDEASKKLGVSLNGFKVARLFNNALIPATVSPEKKTSDAAAPPPPDPKKGDGKVVLPGTQKKW